MKIHETPITGSEDKAGRPNTVQALIDFYTAFNGRDLERMERNWLDSQEVAMDNPLGGIKRGWAEIRSVYERIFSGPAHVYVEFYDYSLHETPECFYAVGRERGEFRFGDTVIPLKIRTSRLYRRVDGQWRQVHHHGSIEDPELLREYQQAVLAKK